MSDATDVTTYYNIRPTGKREEEDTVVCSHSALDEAQHHVTVRHTRTPDVTKHHVTLCKTPSPEVVQRQLTVSHAMSLDVTQHHVTPWWVVVVMSWHVVRM